MWIKGWMIGLGLENLGGLWLEGWMEGCGGLVDGGLEGGGSGMDGGKGFLNRTEPNRKENRTEPREPKPSQNPSEKRKRTETKRGFTVFAGEPSRSS